MKIYLEKTEMWNNWVYDTIEPLCLWIRFKKFAVSFRPMFRFEFYIERDGCYPWVQVNFGFISFETTPPEWQ